MKMMCELKAQLQTLILAHRSAAAHWNLERSQKTFLLSLYHSSVQNRLHKNLPLRANSEQSHQVLPRKQELHIRLSNTLERNA